MNFLYFVALFKRLRELFSGYVCGCALSAFLILCLMGLVGFVFDFLVVFVEFFQYCLCEFLSFFGFV